jgi:putative NADH-flavin reductase
MKLLILGATGNLGLHVVESGLRKGHKLTVIVRSPDKLSQHAQQLRIIGGNPLDSDELARAAQGQDAVISAMGARTLQHTTVRTDFARAAVRALERNGPSRLVVTSVAFLFPEAGFLSFLLGGTIFRKVRTDAADMETAVVASRLDWTIVRPPRFIRGESGGHYRTVMGHLPPRGRTIRLGDLANYLIETATSQQAVRAIVGIAQ